MMGDKFQLGPFKDVIVTARQRVTRGTRFFEKVFQRPNGAFAYVLEGRCPGRGGAFDW
ncbi:hypothetical protein J3A64_003075 [Pseudarthrobacter sp. PvP004]|nr:hypothetical protein [Pseudarthrobacter sp. PvP004]